MYYLERREGVAQPEPGSSSVRVLRAQPPRVLLGRRYLSSATFVRCGLICFYGITCLIRRIEFAALFTTFEESMC